MSMKHILQQWNQGPRTYAQVVQEGKRDLEVIEISSDEENYDQPSKQSQIDISSEEEFPFLFSKNRYGSSDEDLKPLVRPRRRTRPGSFSVSSSETTPKKTQHTTSIETVTRETHNAKREIDIGLSTSDEDTDLDQRKSEHGLGPSEFWDGNDLLPIFKRGMKRGIESKESFNILNTKSEYDNDIARTVPCGVQDDVLFLVDLEVIGHWKNLLADDNGTWRQTGKRVNYVNLLGDTHTLSTKQEVTSGFRLIRYPYVSSSSDDFHRVIILLENISSRNIQRLCIVQYYFDGTVHPIRIKPHGNSKSSKPFMKTMESTKNVIKEKAKLNTPKTVYHDVIKDLGGIESITSCGQKARDVQQIKNFRRENKLDDVVEVLNMSKESDSYIKKISLSPEFSVVLTTEQQLIDIERFCTNPEGFCILGVDTTFNIGDYYVTLTTYRNLHLLTHSNVHPVMIGPSLIHHRKLYESFVQLPSTMLELKPTLKNVMCIGSDGEKNLYSSFQNTFSGSKHLLCDIHMRDNIKRKLRELSVEQEASSIILRDIFGTNYGSTKARGLVDCEDRINFQEELDEVINKWSSINSPSSSKIQEFIVYFKEKKAHMIRNCMTAEIRTQCGLGIPPEPFTQNPNECMNRVIKMKQPGEKTKLSPAAFIQKLQGVVQRQEDDAVLAVLGQGDLKLADDYKHLAVSESKYYRMSMNQKSAVRKRFLSAKVCSKIQVSSQGSDNLREHNLSVLPQNSGIASVPFEILKGMFAKAAGLVASKVDIVKAPGQTSNTYFVTNASSSEPHSVKVGQRPFDLACDRSCFRWRSFKICQHVLAVAEIRSQLNQFCEYFRKSSTEPSLSSMTAFGAPSDRGKKASKATQRRKGPQRETVISYADDETQMNFSRDVQFSDLTSISSTSLPLPSSLAVSPLPSLASSGTVAHPTTSVNQISTISSPDRPNPLPGSYHISLLQLCDRRVTRCYGCKGYLKSNGTIPEPPNDLVIVTKCNREYNKDGVPHTTTAPCNVYFHMNIQCVKKQNEYFIPAFIFIPQCVKEKLSECHKSVLKSIGLKV